jgi:hypothetical protein
MITSTRLLVVFCFVVGLLTLLTSVDLALTADVGRVPYSPVWVWLNPFYDTQLAYRLYLVTFETIALSSMVWAHWRWRLPFRVALSQLAGLLVIVSLHWHQNVTVVAFAWSAYYAWWLALLAIQKLPLGWSWNLSDSHYACYQSCYQGNRWLSWDHDLIYILLLWMVAYPLWAQWHLSRINSKPYIP